MIANTPAATTTTEPKSVSRSSAWVRLASLLTLACVLADWALAIYLNAITWAGSAPKLNDLDWLGSNVLWGVLFPMAWLSFAIIGAIIVARRPGNTIGWLCLAFGVFGALEDLPWRLARIVASPWWAGMLSLAASVFYALYLPMTLTLLLLHFPDGRYLSRNWRSVGFVAVGCAALSIFGTFIRPVAWVGNTREVPNPLWLMPWSDATSMSAFSWALSQTALLVGMITLGAAVVSLVVRWRRAEAVERQQLKWLTFACVVSMIFALFGFASNQFNAFTFVMGLLAVVGFGIGVPVCIGIAILRHHLWDIDLVINRALVYGVLTALVAGVYALGVGTAGRLLQSQNELATGVLALVCAVVVALALRRRIEWGVDRILPLQRRDADALDALDAQQPTSHTPDTRLSGAPLVIARAAWLLIAVLGVGLFVYLVIVNLIELRVDPSAVPQPYIRLDQIPPEAIDSLRQYGLSAGFYRAYYLAFEILWLLLFCMPAALLFWRKFDERMALLTSFALLTIGLFSTPLVVTLLTSPVFMWRVMGGVLPNLGPLLLFFFSYLFPDGHFVPRWTRWPAVIFGALLAVVSILPALFPGMTAEVLMVLAFPPGVIGSAIAIAAQIYRYRRVSSPIQRQQTKWVLFGLCAPTVWMLVLVASWAAFSPLIQSDRFRPLFGMLSGAVTIVLFGLVPLFISISILRYRLWDIKLVVKRTLAYGLLLTTVAILYMLIVGGLSAVFQSSGNLFIAIIATGLIAVLFNRLRVRVQRAVNRALYGERDDPVAVLSRLGQQLETTIVPDAALKGIVDTVGQSLKLPYAEIALKEGDGFKVVAMYDNGARRRGDSDGALPLALIHQGETVGELRVSPHTPGEAFSSQDMTLLKNIAHQAGATAHAALLMRDLQRSRERIVTAREEERRRLRRDMHDGLGPTLASQTLKLDAAMDLVESDPDKAMELLSQLKRQTQTTVADVRRLVYELRPPALDEQGLVGAIRNFGFGIADFRLEIQTPQALPPLPAAVEVAAYRITTEAITNVMKHAKARKCIVQIALLADVKPRHSTGSGGAALQIAIQDDGIGIDPAHPIGVGLHSMRERAEELGGTLTIESKAGEGTTVIAELPIGNRQP